MNVEIGAEAALFPEKEYINGIALAVHIEWETFHHKCPGSPSHFLLYGEYFQANLIF